MTGELPRLVCIDPAQIEAFWPHVAPLIDRACERFGSEDERQALERQIKDGNALVWLAWSNDEQIEAALVTDLVEEDSKRICQLRALSGRRIGRWFRLLDQIEKFARDERCAEIRYFGRPGWASMFPSEYRVTHVRASKKLN